MGQQAPFDYGRPQMKLLPDLDVTTPSVERNDEAIGEDTARTEQREIQRAMRWDLPIITGDSIPILYMQMDSTGVPVVKKRRWGKKARKMFNRPISARSSWGACARKRIGMTTPTPFAARNRPTTPAPSIPLRSSANASIWKLGIAAGTALIRKLSWDTRPNEFETSPNNKFRAHCKSSMSTTRANISGIWRAGFNPMKKQNRKPG